MTPIKTYSLCVPIFLDELKFSQAFYIKNKKCTVFYFVKYRFGNLETAIDSRNGTYSWGIKGLDTP